MGNNCKNPRTVTLKLAGTNKTHRIPHDLLVFLRTQLGKPPCLGQNGELEHTIEPKDVEALVRGTRRAIDLSQKNGTDRPMSYLREDGIPKLIRGGAYLREMRDLFTSWAEASAPPVPA